MEPVGLLLGPDFSIRVVALVAGLIDLAASDVGGHVECCMCVCVCGLFGGRESEYVFNRL